MTSQVIEFYCHGGSDSNGRTARDMIAMSDHDLEMHHDIIQWMFPLHETSMVNPGAPLVDEDSAHVLRENIEAQLLMREMIVRFARFMGFELNEDGQFVAEPLLAANRKNWHTQLNHNHLRVTRVIRSLRLFGFDQLARAFFQAVAASALDARCIDNRTLAFWNMALEDEVFDSLRK